MVVIDIRAFTILLALMLGLLFVVADARPHGNVSPGYDWLSPGYTYTYWYGYPSHYSWYTGYYPYSYYYYPSNYYYPYSYNYPYSYRSYYWYPNTYNRYYWWYW